MENLSIYGDDVNPLPEGWAGEDRLTAGNGADRRQRGTRQAANSAAWRKAAQAG
jgi:hypothetical protein